MRSPFLRRFGMPSPFLDNEAGFSPSILLTGSTAFAWYDPSDLSTMFQDSAGTTPVTAAGQPVGRILDKSGNGFHATQSTAASRPTYARHPLGGIRNLLTFTEAMTVGNGWTILGTGVVETYPSEGASGIEVTRTASGSGFGLSPLRTVTLSGATTGLVFTGQIRARSVSGPLSVTMTVRETGGATGNEETVLSGLNLTTEFQTFTATRTLLRNDRTGVTFFMSSGGAGDYVVEFVKPQLETGSTATAYQKVVSQFDVTEAGVPSLSYLSFDGVDDFLVTSTITPSANKMQVFAGFRKLSDAASFPVLAELSANSTSNSGVFLLSGRSAGAAGMLFQSKGTVVASSSSTTAAAPITQVVTGLGDISAPSAQIWTNQTAISPTTTDQGTGNYLAYPIYLGRRGGTSAALNMWLYGLIVRFSTANLDAGQISQTQQWMATKAGVTF